MNDVILQPLVTEKSMIDIKLGKYTFKVAGWANKTQIKKAVKDRFSADAVSITTSNMKKKKKMMGRREVTKGAWKKATILVKKGQKIEIFNVDKK